MSFGGMHCAMRGPLPDQLDQPASLTLAQEYHRLAAEFLGCAIEEPDVALSARLMRLAEEYEELGQFEDARAA